MLTYFPRYFTFRAIICYVVTLFLVSVVFINYVMPFQFMLFGFAEVMIFFLGSHNLSLKWGHFRSETFSKKLFTTALLIRLAYVIFIYFYYIDMTGEPFGFSAGDELFYQEIGELWREYGFQETREAMVIYGVGFSDSGYCWWLGFEYLLLGTHVLPARLIKCVIDAFSCVLIYNLGKRNFGEAAGRMAALFCMLMPNMWFYCGVTLKETEMVFLTILFVERGDLALRSSKISFQNILLPGLLILVMFTIRPALAAVMAAALVGALILSSGRQLQAWKKVLYSAVFAGWMFATVGAEMIEETQTLWEGRTENQSMGYEVRGNREEGNSFMQYATAATMAPLIFSIPISSMVHIPFQDNQMLLNGANFVKNILSGFTIFALVTMLFMGTWRKHVLPLAVTCGYLLVIVFSTFAHAERFHFPVLAFELMFAAYGVTLLRNKHKRWIMIWMIFVCVGVLVWNLIKLRGRGWA